MESARRASDMHKKRTGRALHITEADVLNEEMYEEIIDLPSRYGLLDSHYKAQHAEFDRRILAYIGTQVATRNLLGQAISAHGQNSHLNDSGQAVATGTAKSPVSRQHPMEYQHPTPPQHYHHHSQLPQVYDQQLGHIWQRQQPQQEQNHHFLPTQQLSISPGSPGQAHPQSMRNQVRPGSRENFPPNLGFQNLAFHDQSTYTAQGQFANAAAPYDGNMVLQQAPNAVFQASPSQRLTSTTSDSCLPYNIPREDSAIDVVEQSISPQQVTMATESTSHARRHTVPSPLSVSLPIESQQLFACSPSEIALYNTPQSPQCTSGPRQYSYNPNCRPRSSHARQAYPSSMSHMAIGEPSQCPATGSVGVSMEQIDYHGAPPCDNPAPSACYNKGGTGRERLATNPLMSPRSLSALDEES